MGLEGKASWAWRTNEAHNTYIHTRAVRETDRRNDTMYDARHMSDPVRSFRILSDRIESCQMQSDLLYLSELVKQRV